MEVVPQVPVHKHLVQFSVLPVLPLCDEANYGIVVGEKRRLYGVESRVVPIQLFHFRSDTDITALSFGRYRYQSDPSSLTLLSVMLEKV